MKSQTEEGEGAEERRLREDKNRIANWKRWGPYLSERQWGTVREDYSPNGNWLVTVFILTAVAKS